MRDKVAALRAKLDDLARAEPLLPPTTPEGEGFVWGVSHAYWLVTTMLDELLREEG